jgi:hypothetical protein
MRKRLLIVLGVVALVAGLALPAWAIVWGQLDGDDHPYVVNIVFDVDGTPSHRCSGAFLNEDWVLTAGHCTFGTSGARVYPDNPFTLDLGYPFTGGLRGETFAHPDYDDFATFPNTSDVGLVMLTDDTWTGPTASLAPLGAVRDAYNPRVARGGQMTIVGFGLQGIVPNPNVIQADPFRYQGDPMIIELDSALTGGFNIHLGSNPGKGKGSGGACFGDSGGPALIEGTDLIGGVGSFVLNLNCVGSGFYYRVDTAHAQGWINSMLP